MRPFILRPNLAEATLTQTLVLDGTVDEPRDPADTAEVYWRFLDDPSMPLQYLGEGKIGSSVSVPFENLERRPIRFLAVGKTRQGVRSVSDVKNARYRDFYPPTQPILISAVFDPGDDEVDLEFTGNGGDGDIYIMRKSAGGDFAVIATVPFDATDHADAPPIDGTYTYKLTQQNVAGESNEIEVEVDVGSAGAGSPPTDLAGSYDGSSFINLTWTNNGGTGDNVVEVKVGLGGIWTVADTVSSATSGYAYGASPSSVNVAYRFRVRNTSVDGYSNEVQVTVPKEFI